MRTFASAYVSVLNECMSASERVLDHGGCECGCVRRLRVFARSIQGRVSADLVALGHDDKVHGGPLRADAQGPLEGQEGGGLALLERDPQDRRHQVPKLAPRHLPGRDRA